MKAEPKQTPTLQVLVVPALVELTVTVKKDPKTNLFCAQVVLPPQAAQPPVIRSEDQATAVQHAVAWAKGAKDPGTVETTIDYTNWKGIRSKRRILPYRVWFGSTQWHQKPQWFLFAFDQEKHGWRDFAMQSIHAWL